MRCLCSRFRLTKTASCFPISLYSVDGEAETIPLHSRRDKLVWTGRIAPHATVSFQIRLRGQGLDRFRYVLVPAMSARNVDLVIDIEGGDNFDYPRAVVPAHTISNNDGHIRLSWHFDSLASGVPIGLLLPSENSFDAVITTMALRAWAPFSLLFAIVVLLAHFGARSIARHDAYLLAATYSFFFILLPYLAAYMNFYIAYALSAAIIGSLMHVCLQRICAAGRIASVGLIGASLLVPSVAVIFEQHTGLIYCIEILAGLALISVLMGNQRFREVIDELTRVPISEPTLHTQGGHHAQL